MTPRRVARLIANDDAARAAGGEETAAGYPVTTVFQRVEAEVSGL